eukprot:CAMPEP_0172384122 /NCGR_PEP_ID=MMETSP1061-20121228/1922_1 /TAXON_ID=37318 /ORGANISM="Pseudo-nitzschia pungens, Strain cf. pungens" /LENGTH=126 /DNA_ID=CAMNT_0013112639 /DNA_START=122 /DNA_END=499 /DNA_ORIENTATION=+
MSETSTLSLTVRLCDGESLSITVSSSESTIGETKLTIESARSDFEASRQRLVYKGRILDDDDRSLSDYGVTASNSTLFLVMSGKPKKAAASATATRTATATSSTSTSSTTTSTPTSSNPAPTPAAS